MTVGGRWIGGVGAAWVGAAGDGSAGVGGGGCAGGGCGPVGRRTRGFGTGGAGWALGSRGRTGVWGFGWRPTTWFAGRTVLSMLVPEELGGAPVRLHADVHPGIAMQQVRREGELPHTDGGKDSERQPLRCSRIDEPDLVVVTRGRGRQARGGDRDVPVRTNDHGSGRVRSSQQRLERGRQDNLAGMGGATAQGADADDGREHEDGGGNRDDAGAVDRPAGLTASPGVGSPRPAFCDGDAPWSPRERGVAAPRH